MTGADPALSSEEQSLAPRQSPSREFWLTFKENKPALLGLYIFLLFSLIAISGLFLTSGKDPLLDPSQIRLQDKLKPPLSSPSPDLKKAQRPPLGMYVLGTDDLGRDILARMLQGSWVSLTVGFVAVGISLCIGIIIGGLSGFFGQNVIGYDLLIKIGVFLTAILMIIYKSYVAAFIALFAGIAYLLWSGSSQKQLSMQFRTKLAYFLKRQGISLDTVLMRFVDIMLCFPAFFLILTVVALLPASIYNIMIIIGLTSWMVTARFVRAEFLTLREQDFVTAAKALGLSNPKIIFKHMLPNAIAPVLVSGIIGIANAILIEAGLSFLGFGVPPPHATWGNILSQGKDYIFDAPWLTLIPGLAILIIVLAFNLCGEGFRDTLNPKLRN